MILIYIAKLGLAICKINIKVQKIENLPLMFYSIVIIGFWLQNKLEKIQVFDKTFLLADITIEMILKILFLSFNNINIWFSEVERFI